ncbi:MAG: hypothetical protein LBQ40_06790 [Clostridiales bacterium]|jgi:hypothetical protein|nr:hypothetical protein [Clostridiales bacterium]
MKKDIYKNLSEYDKKIHASGRIWVLVCDTLFVCAPIAIAVYLNAKPDYTAFFAAFGVVAVIYWSSAIAEFAIFAPLLGPGATYLAFVTGNISNIKLPCALNAQETAKTPRGSKESEVVSTIAVAVSALTQTVIMGVGVVFLAIFTKPLETFFAIPEVEPVFDCILPALFGALGYSYIIKNPRLAVVPMAFMLILYLAFPGFANKDSVAIMIIFIGVVSLISAVFLFQKGLLDGKNKKIGKEIA